MTHPVFVALHRGPDSGLGVTRWHLSSEEATVCESAIELLQQLQQLHDSRAADTERAQADARAAGWAAGRSEALDSVAPALLQAWQQAAAQAQADARALRGAVVLLSRHVVRRIAAGLAPADVVGALALRATEELLPGLPLVVRVHPDLHEAVRRHLDAAGRPLDAAALEVRAEPGIDLLDCRVDTPQGQLLAGLDTQLDNVVRNLQQRAESSQVPA